MRRRILTAILAITALSILLFGVPLAIVVERFVDQDATLRLERQAILAARDVPADYATNGDPVELPTGDGGTTIALYDMSGNLVAGDGPATADQVTASALANRVSDHEAGEFRVVAVPVTADEHVVGAIRAEQSTAASDARTWRIMGLIGGLAVTVFAVGAAVAVVVARRLARPVGHLTGATVALGHGIGAGAGGEHEAQQGERQVECTHAGQDTAAARRDHGWTVGPLFSSWITWASTWRKGVPPFSTSRLPTYRPRPAWCT